MLKLVVVRAGLCVLAAALLPRVVSGQQSTPPAAQEHPPEHVHDMHMDMPMDAPAGNWHLMQDGSVYLAFNRQGGPRGGDEFMAPNWWMGMASHRAGPGTLTLTGMLSLDAASVGSDGYRELFQVGEAFDGRPVVDRQHPHDFWMQVAGAWRTTVSDKAGVTLAGALAGEPALGPVAFMHRASAAAIPLAPLGHHTFDSTHVAFGVATLGVDRGPVTVEGSVFNGREPDQARWDLDLGPMDSWSARFSYRPTQAWELQVSSGHLHSPEELGHGNVVRTTASGSYLKGSGGHMLAATVGVGMNATDDVTRHAGFGEVSGFWGSTVGSLRVELLEVETQLLRTGALPLTRDAEAMKSRVGAMTLGVQRDMTHLRGAAAAVGANVSFYAAPPELQATHGRYPVSFQLFVQVRPPVGAMGRMWNMRMGR